MAITAFSFVTSFPGKSPPPLASVVTAFAYSALSGADEQDGGRYRVVGTTKYVGPPSTPVSRYVRLYDSVSGRLVRAQWSTPAGAYSFHNIRLGNFFVASQDYTGQYNGVIATNITSEAMA